MRFAAICLVAFACSGAFASEPGQPLDCSDWVSDLPGYTCDESIVPYDTRGSNVAIDNQGFRLYLSRSGSGPFGLVRQDPMTGDEHYVGHITGRSGLGNTSDEIQGTPMCPSETLSPWQCHGSLLQSSVLWFDPMGGTLSIPVISHCNSNGSSCNPALFYDDRLHTLRIHGFAALFEIFQSYVPQPGLSFRVPYMPEGMAGADHFDTYWGPLAHPIDFAQAHPLQCNYPAAAPHVGDYLTIADTVPTPAPGQGVYYVTAATYQGATRYGRKTTNRHLTGRDPALLPTCTP